jgi:ketosteroid isomerase-like protein
MKTPSLPLAVLCISAFFAPLAGAQSPQPDATQSPLERQIVAKEREGLDALKTGALDRFAALTADDAVFVDAAGSASKQQVMKNVAGFRLTDYTIEDLKFVALSSKSGLISYKIAEQGVSHGKEFKAKAYVSSVWAKHSGQWICLFSQETAAR